MKRAGMTLVEAMVALLILAVIGTMVWAGFTQTSRNKALVEQEADYYHVARIAMDRMQRELSMAFVSAQNNANPMLRVTRTAFVGTDRSGADRVDFTSFAHRRLMRDAHESDQNEISYFITRDPDDSRQKVLARREQNRIDDDPQRGGRIQIMVHDVRDFSLEYLDPQTDEWTSSWDTTQGAMQPNRLPAQVRIVLTLGDVRRPRRERVFATRAVLPITWGLNHAIY